jgi:hypothetical protein
VFNILEAICTVILVNAEHTKAVPGHKTDVRDSEGCVWARARESFTGVFA